jgi:excisionase family DNA binding protein
MGLSANPFEIIEQRFNDLEKLIRLSMATQKVEAPTAPKYITKKDAADYLGISTVTLDRMTADGSIQAYRLGGRVMFRINDLEKALKPINLEIPGQ